MIERFPDLELFTRIVEAGSLSAAARSLGMTQPTVSKRLAAMERELAVRLVQRSTHRLRLTEEGQAWYEACRRWVAELREVSGSLRGQGAGVTGTLRVNAPVSLGRHVLLPLIQRFLAEHPEASVDLTLDDRRVDLVLDNVDVAVRVGAIANPEVVARRLISYRTQLVAAPSYLAKRGRPRTVQDLLGHTALFYGRPASEDVEGPTGRVRLSGNARLFTNDSGAFLSAVEAGLGIGTSAPWLFAAGLAAGRLEPVLPGTYGERYVAHAIFLPSRVLPARVRALVGFLQREVIKQVAGLPGVEANR